MNRRQFLFGMSLGLSALSVSRLSHAGLGFWPDDGWHNPCLSGRPQTLQSHPLMQAIWSGIDATQMWDSHMHLVGTGDSSSGIWFNPNMDSYWHPLLKAQKHFYMNGLCADPKRVDDSALERMVHLHTEMPAGYKSMLFAFDWYRDTNGKPLKEHAIFHIPNSYAANVANTYPQHFEWVASIHPYRPDAIDALEQAKAQGARAIKWLPSGMGINPASKKCDAFYKKAAQLNIPIISHAGYERAVQGGDQSYGNPLKMRRALDAGVRVVLAHCASDGEDEDLDNGRKTVKSFDLFARLMDTPQYAANLLGEVSAITLINHAWVIPHLLARKDWHARLVNGSDYPLPAVYPLINLTQLQRMGLLSAGQLPFLQALKSRNALLFDFAVKRLLRFDGHAFANSVFETRRYFDISLKA